MSIEDIIKQINPIFIEILDKPGIDLKPQTTSDDIEEWDSLNHIQLIVAIEKYFKIKFTAAEIVDFNNVGELCEAIIQKL